MDPLLLRVQADPAAALGPQTRRHPRRASDLRGIFQDAGALEALIRDGNPVIYETFEAPVPASEGHLMFGMTVLYPGRVGDEYFMTKGHYHERRLTAEVYLGIRGRGCLVVQTEDGRSRMLPMEPGGVVYVAPGWAHRSVNTGAEPFIFFFTFPADAGHDYAAVARSGFDLLVVHRTGAPAVVERSR